MTHDIYFVKTRTNIQKQTDVLKEKYLCFKGKDMYFRWRRQNRDRTGPDRNGPDWIKDGITDRITEKRF